MSRRISNIWNYFEVKSLVDKTASCNHCRKVLKYKSTISNLKLHLKVHKNVYDEFCQSEAELRKKKIMDNTNLDNKTVSSGNGLNGDSDEENALGDDDVYTEVVYLEDDINKRNSSPKKRQRVQTHQQNFKSRIKNERKLSESSDEYEKRKKEHAADELEIFINYVRCLLKKVPKEASPKLHLDIINLIMNAQCNHSQNNVFVESVNLDNAEPNLTSVLDKSIILTQNVPSTSCGNATQRVITVPLQNLLSQSSEKLIAVPIPQLYSVSSSNTTNNTNTIATSIMTSLPVASTTVSLPTTKQ